MSLGDDLDDGLEYEVQPSESEEEVELENESETVKRSLPEDDSEVVPSQSQSKRQKKLAKRCV